MKNTIGGEFVVDLVLAGTTLQQACHVLALESGWWTDLQTGVRLNTQHNETPRVSIPEKLMLCVSELAEAMEGYRKNLMDDKLPHRKMLEVELADTVIRCFDLAGGIGLDLGGAIVEKLQYNSTRQDHSIENRKLENGKKF